MARRGRILVIEDDETLRETIGEVMTDEGHEVRLASNGQEALDRLDGWEAEVVILDLMMPEMDAYAFRDRQLAAGLSPAARILVLSAGRDLESAAERLAAAAWLTKPFSLVEAIEVVERLLAGTGTSGTPQPDDGSSAPADPAG